MLKRKSRPVGKTRSLRRISILSDAAKCRKFSRHTKRPLIVYAVDFLNEAKAQAAGSGLLLDWSDKEGFIEAIQGIEGKTVDIFLHSPGGLPKQPTPLSI